MSAWKVVVMDGDIVVKTVAFDDNEQGAYDTLADFADLSPSNRMVELWHTGGDRPVCRRRGWAEIDGATHG